MYQETHRAKDKIGMQALLNSYEEGKHFVDILR